MPRPAQHTTQSTDDVYYQTHRLVDGIWLIEEDHIDRRALGPILDRVDDDVLENGEALRVVRFVVDRRGALRDQTIVHFWPDADDTIDRVMPAVAKPADVLWLNPDDIYSDLARYQMARGYATFLKSRHLCVEELLHHPAGGLELVNAWQAMQAGLQPIALMQAHVMELSGPERVRELTKMLEELFQTLALEQKNNPPEMVTVETYVDVFDRVSKANPLRARYAMARVLATRLAGFESFAEKLRVLVELADVVETRAQAEPLDHMLASIIGAHGFMADLAKGRPPILWLSMLADMLMGQFDEDRETGIDCQPFNDLMLAGFLPRTRAAIRRRIIVEARSIGGSATGTDLIAELSEVDRTVAQLEQRAPTLVGDPELAAVWQQRINRALTADNLQRVLLQNRQPTQRLSVASSLFPMMRSLGNRNELGRLLAAQLSIREIGRELVGASEKPSGSIPPLLKFHQRIAGYLFDENAQDSLLGAVDDHVLDVVQSMLDPKQGGDDLDRIIMVLKTWLPAPMDRGRTSALIRDKLADAIQKPEFFNRFWNSFRSSKVRQQANEALELLLHEYGLKANKIALAMEDEPSN
ncbi:MAG TPA: hypothetical protein DFI00_03800 [Rhodospirillaceae bacterium]|nr:hypothetical protein [Alphaproteobacteria bacterium]OUT39615.1 MAG: hypothetical protein CBB62_14735 [Micavibrio sp. TMED2]HCI46398.1 hypothetical protein [Rhodospirillaceae bacterium]MAS49008.1 hypothetical protein [Alphaproteobacteria bacterium]MAX97390.1 hypothetical protein [Alphaproteobacteria bacterium]|tara:strand:+ start:3944 stop:5695 length:1752 start_codon:yes stop_codon:yes gene_type:complete